MEAGTCASLFFPSWLWCLVWELSREAWKQEVEVATNVEDAAGSGPVSSGQRRRLLETRAWVWF